MELFVVIPCYNEPDILSSLDSLADCVPPTKPITVIVVVNSSEDCDQTVLTQNQQSLNEIANWQVNKPQWMHTEITHQRDVPKKIAGVGNARKSGMDHAYHLAKNKSNAVIVCYDADCTCSRNYLQAIEQSFHSNPSVDLATIYFEHNIEQSAAIIDYELFLRYHYQGLKFTGYPYAYQTIGSSMAVRAKTYNQFGGMNQRKAGEDFYFLHKIMPYRNVIEINDCSVYPSGRTSDRVPFGTGHAVAKFHESTCKTYYTYHPNIYKDIQKLISAIEAATLDGGLILQGVSKDIHEFLSKQKFDKSIQQFKKQSKTDALFQQAIYRWLNGFRMLKLVHYLRDQSYTNFPINESVSLFWSMKFGNNQSHSNKEWLERFRVLEKESINV